MARTDTRFREAYNQLLDLFATLPELAPIPAESALSETAGVSRTVVRRCLARMEEGDLIEWNGRAKRLLRAPGLGDRIAIPEGPNGAKDLEQRFLDWILRFDVPANTPLSVAELSRTFDVAPHELNEFLAGLSRFGLVARRRQGGWMLLGFTRDFAVELSEFRLVLELNAVRQVANAPVDHPIWARLSDLRKQHRAIEARLDTDFHEFSMLDETFHVAINSVVKNRFTAEFQKVISLIFHYHYLWDKTHERDRNQAAITEHLALMDALEARDERGAVAAAERHLRTSKTTLLSSLRYHDLA